MSVLARDAGDRANGKSRNSSEASRTLKIKQRRLLRNLDKKLSTKKYEPNLDFGNETRKKITIASIVNERLSSENDFYVRT